MDRYCFVVVWFRSLSEVRRGCSDGVAWYGDHANINSCCYNYSMQAIFVEASKACGDAFVIVIVMARLHVVISCDVLWIPWHRQF